MTELYLNYDVPETERARCADCGWQGLAKNCDMVVDAQERLDPGCTVPAGQCPECRALAYLVEEPPKSRRWYVCMLWDEGGSYTGIFEAADSEAAEALCKREMAECHSDGDEERVAEVLEHDAPDWEVADIFDVDQFIAAQQR